MFGRHVQRFEVVPVVLEFRALDDLVAHADEDVFDPLAHLRQRMATAERRHAARQGDVDARRTAARRPAACSRASSASSMSGLRALTAAPSARRSSGDAAPSDLSTAVTSPCLRLRKRSRTALTSAAVVAGDEGCSKSARSAARSGGAGAMASVAAGREPAECRRTEAVARYPCVDSSSDATFRSAASCSAFARSGPAGERRERVGMVDGQVGEALRRSSSDAGGLEAADELAVGRGRWRARPR